MISYNCDLIPLLILQKTALIKNGLFSAIPYVAFTFASFGSGQVADLLRAKCLSTTVTRKLMNTIGILPWLSSLIFNHCLPSPLPFLFSTSFSFPSHLAVHNHTLTHSHTHMHACTHARTRTHTHTHTHIHVYTNT